MKVKKLRPRMHSYMYMGKSLTACILFAKQKCLYISKKNNKMLRMAWYDQNMKQTTINN